ncbi:MAG: M3 family oligoendopeptidase [Firmicutes bacterium]|nr:M3 family oligoendopeptidase [Bacillota bacterium]
MTTRFSDFTYRRPDFSSFCLEFEVLVADFKAAKTASMQAEIVQKINTLRSTFTTQATLARIRYTQNTDDEFYSKEQEFFDETEPLYDQLINQYYEALINSPWQKELAQSLGEQLFTWARHLLQTFSPQVIDNLQAENKLISRYKKLLASAAITFDGKKCNLNQLAYYQQMPDRAVRQEAFWARAQFFQQHEEEFDEIFDRLVHLRTEIARRLGFAYFTPLGYLRRCRSDYNVQDVAKVRKHINRYCVPLTENIRRRQQRHLGLKAFKYYDESLFFPEGNPTPQGSPAEILQQGIRMYEELSPETSDFFAQLVEHQLLDVLSRKGKAPGGYCDYLPAFEVPFIFANFNGTAQDLDVLTHEAGHAFQLWLSRPQIPEYQFATMEAAEIPSMGMEFFTRPWMELFFHDQAELYRRQHLSEAFLFLPYGALVDHFQHEVYAQSNLTPRERRRLWRRLEKVYLPYRDYDGIEFYEEGGYWFQQGHIFEAPFYYIDYVLAQICVFELWQRMHSDREQAWQDYLAFCRAGGSLSFLNLLPLAQLSSPFGETAVKNSTEYVQQRLEL